MTPAPSAPRIPPSAPASTAEIPAAPATADYPPDLVRDDAHGHYRKSRRHLLLRNARRSTWRQRVLGWLRDHVHPGIPRAYYSLLLGHDLHISTWATLHVKHFHATQPDPFDPSRVGWWENVGLVSQGKVTTAWRNFVVDNLVTDTTAFGDLKFHRVGTSAQAESNADAALIVDAGLEATGTQVEVATDQYQSVASITADTTETWQEHAIRTAAGGGVMADRSLISPTVSVVASDVVAFTYTMTQNAEA